MSEYKYGGAEYSYIEFLWDVLMFKGARDMEDTPCSRRSPKELWLDMQLESIRSNPDWTEEERQTLILTAKVAELIDDSPSKSWVLLSIEEDLEEIREIGMEAVRKAEQVPA
jgi:hypothetical protein